MSRFGLTPALASAMLFTSAILCGQSEMMAPAAAPAKAGEPVPAAKSDRTADIIKKFDKNGDGKIDDDERADAQEMMLKERVDKQMKAIAVTPGGAEGLRTRVIELFDKNKDGVLDAEERAAAEKAAEDRAASPQVAALRADVMKRFDKNGNGKLDGEEGAEARKFFEQRAFSLAQAEKIDAGGEAFVKRFDKDGNGKLEGDERKAAQESFSQVPVAPLAIAPQTEARREAAETFRAFLIKRGDKDADGKIDEKEFEQLSPMFRPGLDLAALVGNRFDTDLDGKFTDAEWKAAQKVLRAWLESGGPLVASIDPAVEQKRLQSVAAEVARRRAIREGATEMIEKSATSAGTTTKSAAATPKEARKSMEEIASDVAERKTARDEAKTTAAKAHAQMAADLKAVDLAEATATSVVAADMAAVPLNADKKKALEDEIMSRRAERQKKKAEAEAAAKTAAATATPAK